MKKIIYLCAFLISAASFCQNSRTNEQKAPAICGTDQLLHLLKQQNPEINKKLDQMEKKITEYYLNNRNRAASNTTLPTLTIPIVVYIVHNDGVENITDTQVLSQINKLNNYFSGYGLRFCLAKTNAGVTLPGSAANPGIIRLVNSTLTDLTVNTEHAALTATSNLPSSSFLRIWVVKSINNGAASGFSILPEYATPALDGIVMSYKAFGDSAACSCTTLSPSTQTGKILVHEVGHYLGLYHTFEGGCDNMNADCLTNGDKVCDTPPVSSANVGCNVINSCQESSDLPDDINNYMDYTNETCLNHFTIGQLERMMGMIATYRSSLTSTQNQINTGIDCNGGLLASFTTSSSSSCIGTSVTFTAGAVSGATYSWDFGDGNTGSGQIVSHTYNSALNPAVVTLTITNGSNSTSAVQNFYIETCNPLNNTESNWYLFDRNAISFTSGIPTYNNSAFSNSTMNASYPPGVQELSAVQSDNNGQLLFYTDGSTIWNKNHQSINPVGTFLHAGYSSMNGVMIIPDPADATLYYVVTSDCRVSAAFRGLKYTKVKVTAMMAQIVNGQMNIPITVPASLGYQTGANSTAVLTNEGITAIRKSDGYWLLASAVKNFNSTNLLVFNINSNGISFTGEQLVENILAIGSISPRQASVHASSNAKKVAFLSCIYDGATSFIFDFDVCNGTFYNKKPLPAINIYSGEFSPDSKLFYGANSLGIITQFDIESCAITGKTIANVAPNHLGGMQRGPDNKIYVNVPGTPNIAVIHRPNNQCTDLNTNACAYNFNGITMQNSTNVGNGLPNMIEAKTLPVFSNSILSNIARCNTACFAYNFEADICSTSYNWNFGDPASGTTNNTSNIRTPNHVFSAPGTYTVSCTTTSGSITTIINVGIAPVIIGNSDVCGQNNFVGSYSVIIPTGYSAQWSVTGGAISGLSNQSNVVVNWLSPGGTVTVVLTNLFNNCTSTATKNVTTLNLVPSISTDNYCFLNSDYTTSHVTSIPTGYTANWYFEYGIQGTFNTPTNQSNVTATWPTGLNFGYLGLILTSPDGCKFKTYKTVFDQCACNCLNTKTHSYTKSNLTVTFTSGNSSSNCTGVNTRSRFFWGDGVITYSPTHTYATAGTYTVTITPVITGAFDEIICSGTSQSQLISVAQGTKPRQTLQDNLIISPNPASSLLNYRVTLQGNSFLQTIIRTVDGKIVAKKEWQLLKGEHDLSIELPNNISDGMIFVDFISDEIRETRTVLIKK